MSKNKISPIAAATALALSTIAGAQAADNVTIYGIMDIGVLHQNHSMGAGNRDKSQTTVASSGLRQSVLGFKGTEDLGNGLKAFFNLESHFDVDTGRFHDGGDNGGAGATMWRRQSNLGLSGEWGSVTVGRQYGPALLAHIGTEPRAFKENFSNLYGWAYGQINTLTGANLPNAASNASSTNNDVGIFFNNSIQYRNSIGPVSFGVLYSLGEVPGQSSYGNVIAGGITYTGPVVLSASYQEMKDDTTGIKAVKHSGLGLAVPFDAFTVKANFLSSKNKNSGGLDGADFRDYGLGLDWKWNQKNTLTVAYYDNKDKLNTNDHTRTFVLSNDYAFSKRTTWYAVLAHADADNGATLGTSIVAGGTPAGVKTTFLNTGVNHSF